MGEAMRTAYEWQEVKGDTIVDPDGWRFAFDGYEPRRMEEKISEREYEARMVRSTLLLRASRPAARGESDE